MQHPSDPNQAIAIVGIGCRFPKSHGAPALWKNIQNRVTTFEKVPKDRWNHEVFFAENPREIDKSWTAQGSFIHDYRSFAALHYGIAPRRLEVMDPQQRLLIEATRWALQDAGYEAKPFNRDKTAVYVGISISEFQHIVEARLTAMQMLGGDFGLGSTDPALQEVFLKAVSHVSPIRAFSLSGSITALAAASVAQSFQLGGEAYSIDSACASASIAVHNAVQALRSGRVDAAVAGGVYLNLAPTNLVAFTRIGAISPSGRCRPFDARADGFVQSDGVGMLMLKRLADARADGDRIHAVIRGSAANNDGKSEGPMTPQQRGQLAVLRAAYEDARIAPDEVSFFEAHGTATAAGDPVEVASLGSFLKEAEVRQPALFGSVKGNIGHAMAAAGVASLIKAIGALQSKLAPPQADFEQAHDNLKLDQYPLEVCRETDRPLPRFGDQPLRIGVSSFGFGGTNSHIVLEEAPPCVRPKRYAVSMRVADAKPEAEKPAPEALIFTAPTPALLLRFLGQIAALLEEALPEQASLSDLAYTLNARRSHERYRLVVLAKGLSDLKTQLQAAITAIAALHQAGSQNGSQVSPSLKTKQLALYDIGGRDKVAPKLAFMFAGQGAQRVGLLSNLYEHSRAYRAQMSAFDRALSGVLDRPLSSYLYPWTSASSPTDPKQQTAELTATEVCQPAMAALSLAASHFLKELGLKPAVSLGHSLGEFVALAEGGAMRFEEAVKLVAERGRAMADLKLPDPGKMAAVFAPASVVEERIADLDGVWVANINHPGQVSISGHSEAVLAASKRLEADGLRVQPLEVSHAFHTPMMAPIRGPLEAALAGVQLKAPDLVVASGVENSPYGGDIREIKARLLKHGTAPVGFVSALLQAEAAGANVFLQVGAGSVLSGMARQTLQDRVEVLSLASSQDDQGAQLMFTLGSLSALGFEVDFERLYEGQPRRVISLPETPLERQDYWPIKDTAQPSTKLDFALPGDAQLGFKAQSLEQARDRTGATGASTEGLAEMARLFQQQNTLLLQQTQTLISQNQALLGQSGLPIDAAALKAQTEALLSASEQAIQQKTALTTPAPVQPEASVAANGAPKAAKAQEDLDKKLYEVIARVSAFPESSLKAEQRLVDELGFDSLMVADLGGALDKAFPALGALPPSVFHPRITLGELGEEIQRRLHGQTESAAPTEAKSEAQAIAAAADAPLRIYEVKVSPAVRIDSYMHDVSGEQWLVTEDNSEVAEAISRQLVVRGAKVLRVQFGGKSLATPDRLSKDVKNFWPDAYAEGLPEAIEALGMKLDGLIYASTIQYTRHPIEPLHGLLSKLSPKRVAAVTGLGGNLCLFGPAERVEAAGLHAYMKTVARERPEAVIRALDLPPESADEGAAWVLSELLSPKLTVETAFNGQSFEVELKEGHWIAGGNPPGPDDVFLLTGGSGDIAHSLAPGLLKYKPKAILLLGRSAPDERLKALLAELNTGRTQAHYLRADLADAKALHMALVDQPAPTVLLHASGLIEDARVETKSVKSLRRVMDAKILALHHVLAEAPSIQRVLMFSSWAGRFGNPGQADYAAANGILDCYAASGLGSRNLLSIAWPPWEGSKMVESIPSGIREAMRTEGVDFVRPEEGLAITQKALESGNTGVLVLGRNLPIREYKARFEEHFDLEHHPYLLDHQLKGRPVVPLASITDWVADALRLTLPPEFEFSLEGLELVRGVMGGETATLELSGREDPDSLAIQFTIRAGENQLLAYRGRAIGHAPIPRLSPVELSGAPVQASLELDRFYESHLFHGPEMRGIDSIRAVREDGIEGELKTTSRVSFWRRQDRKDWIFDPLMVDASFQLAAYWLELHHQKLGFPIGFDRLRFSQLPPAKGPITARVKLIEVQSEHFKGDISYQDASGRVFLALSGIQGRFAEVRAPVQSQAAPVPSKAEPDESTYNIAMFTEVEELQQRFEMANLIGIENPYFNEHAGTAKNRSVIEGVEMLNFSSYNYLGCSGHPEVVQAAQDAIARYGTSVSASRIASGQRPIHAELEQGIAAHIGVEDSVVFVSGHATNVTVVGHLLGREDLVLHDALIHDSILQGIYLSGATRRPYPHEDLDNLTRVLEQIRHNYRRVLIVAEGIYSMDGDICDLPRLIAIKKRFGALLMIDEAHSMGVLGPSGRGVAHHFEDIDPSEVDIWMGTLSKSFASCGGYIAGTHALVEYLRYTAPGFVYSAGITPPNTAAAIKSLELMQREPERVQRLRDRSLFFMRACNRRGLDTGHAVGAAVVPVIVHNSMDCIQLSQRLKQRKINVQPIVYPAVEDDAARLRFFVSALHTEAELLETAEATAQELRSIREQAPPRPTGVEDPSLGQTGKPKSEAGLQPRLDAPQ